ncbi:MAG: HNH endonuclease [Patescibacteria group bacterium]
MGRLRWYLREEILERDNFQCQVCSSTDRLEIHHIRHWSKGGDHRPTNLVTLCHECHQIIHYNLAEVICSGVDPKNFPLDILDQKIRTPA